LQILSKPNAQQILVSMFKVCGEKEKPQLIFSNGLISFPNQLQVLIYHEYFAVFICIYEPAEILGFVHLLSRKSGKPVWLIQNSCISRNKNLSLNKIKAIYKPIAISSSTKPYQNSHGIRLDKFYNSF